MPLPESPTRTKPSVFPGIEPKRRFGPDVICPQQFGTWRRTIGPLFPG